MEKTRQGVSMGFTREPFPEGTHMCLIFDNDDERAGIISRFLASGIARGEKVGYIFDRTTPEEVRGWLETLGMKVPAESGDGPLSVYNVESIYYPSGRFEPNKLFVRAKGDYDRAVKAGYAGLRGSAEMSWALRGIPGSEMLVEYEARINLVFADPDHPITGVCQYDARLFDGAMLLNILKVHPMMIVKGRIVRNPYYVRPNEYLNGSGRLAA